MFVSDRILSVIHLSVDLLVSEACPLQCKRTKLDRLAILFK